MGDTPAARGKVEPDRSAAAEAEAPRTTGTASPVLASRRKDSPAVQDKERQEPETVAEAAEVLPQSARMVRPRSVEQAEQEPTSLLLSVDQLSTREAAEAALESRDQAEPAVRVLAEPALPHTRPEAQQQLIRDQAAEVALLAVMVAPVLCT